MTTTKNKGGRPPRSSTKHHNPRARKIGIYEPIIEALRDSSDGATALYCLMKPLASWRGRLLDDVLRIRNAARPTKAIEEVDELPWAPGHRSGDSAHGQKKKKTDLI